MPFSGANRLRSDPCVRAGVLLGAAAVQVKIDVFAGPGNFEDLDEDSSSRFNREVHD